MTSKRGKSAIARMMRLAALSAFCFGSVAVGVCGPIHDATRKGDRARVIALLKQNPELVSSKDKLGDTPLHVAALHDQPEIAELLLANGADVNAENTVARADSDGVGRSGETPLTLALLSYEHKEMVELLLTHGADVNVMLSGGTTPLLRAVERDLPYDAELLLANGADPNANGEAPLYLAVFRTRTRILQLLLDYGADPNGKGRGGHTPLWYAEQSNYDKGIALLRAHGGHE